MSAQRHARLSRIFLEVVDLPAEDRAARLDRLCGDDLELRRQIEQMLSHHGDAATFDEPLDPTLVRRAISDELAPEAIAMPARIGAYEILGILGQGGMGTVYRAMQQRPARLVALKVLNPALVTPAMIRRFEFEAQVMADLHHPGIAEIYEAGTTDVQTRTPYFAMELVTGQTLTAHADARRLDRRQRLMLMRTVCDAVHHAHQRGIIHRDLKPGNILITDAGEPKILDFGIARPATPELRAITLQTQPGQIVGTLPYMSPEQVQGVSAIDTRSDVYALGVILYELLSGRLPHDLSGRSIAEAVRTLETADPPTLGVIDRSLRGDLDTLVSRAMHRDVGRRYGSAADLAREIERYLAGEPIEALRDSRAYVIRKTLIRYRVPVAVGCALTLVLAAATAVSVNYGIREARQRRLAENRADETRQVAQFQSRMLRDIDVQAMGRGLKNRLREQIREGLGRAAAGASGPEQDRAREQIPAQLEAFDALASSAIGADVARSVLDEFVLDRAAGALESQFKDQPLLRAQLHQGIGDAYVDLGLFERGEAHLREAIRLRRPGSDLADAELTRAIISVARSLSARNRYADAQTMYAEALERLVASRGAGSGDAATVMIEQASLRMNLGDSAGSQDLFDRALPQLRAAYGDRSLMLASGLSNKGEMLRRKGDIPGAEAAHREALEMRRSLLGDRHADVAVSLNNLANLLTESGRYEQAEPLQSEALEIQIALLGAEHPEAVSSRHNLANIRLGMGKIDQAEAGFREAIELHRRLQGDGDSLGLARSLTGLGLVLMRRGDFAGGEPLLREAVRVFAQLGTQHADYASALNNLAALLHRKGDLDSAEPLYRQGLEIRRALPTYEHVDVAQLINNYAALLRDKGKPAASEPVYREAIAMFRKVAPDHPGLGASLAGLGRVLDAQDKNDQAQDSFREALEFATARGPDSRPLIDTTRARLGRSLAKSGRFGEARDLLVPLVANPDGSEAPAGPATLLALEGLVDLDTAWESAQPGKGHAEDARHWKVRLDAARPGPR